MATPFSLIVRNEKLPLYFVARNMVLRSMRQAWRNCRSKHLDPEEADLVASLVLTGTRILDIGWREILAPYKIKIAVTGIYCHQSPMAQFSGMRKNYCELGDLLWCHIHTDLKGDIVRNAILYQAKNLHSSLIRFPLMNKTNYSFTLNGRNFLTLDLKN
jgi:hypothetical protein